MKLVTALCLVGICGCDTKSPNTVPNIPTQPIPIPKEPVDYPKENMLPKVFAAIRSVETGSHPNPAEAIGANGEIGPFQITKGYFKDAVEHDTSLSGLWFEGCKDAHVARVVMIAYWERWAIEWTPEELCRLHNGGPTKRGTDEYWERCKNLLDN